VVNVGRILLILAAGRAWGEGFAVDVLHPAVGLVMILAATAVMLALLPLFRLRLELPHMRARDPDESAAPPRRRAVDRARVPVAVLLVATAVATMANSGMSRFELLAFGLGPPRLGPDSLVSTRTQGWSLTPSAEYSALASRYFGSHGSWARYAYVQTTDRKNLSAPAAITLDVVDTDDLGTFTTYGLEACYRFHNYSLVQVTSVDLGGSLSGKVVRYQLPQAHADWLALYWEWPVRVPGTERYQRVVLSVDTSASSNELDQQSLVRLARSMVQRAAESAPHSNDTVF
jgi:hypothetical protein